MHVLIVEDEKDISKEINLFLQKEKFICDSALNAEEASEKIAVNLYDFILLDLGLPDRDGLTLLEEAKSNKVEASFIVLSARGSIEDRINGLNGGADDYLPKPFSLPELLSRMQAITRRKYGLQNNNVDLEGLTVNIKDRVVSFNDNVLNLTKKEFDLLAYLLLNKNRVLTRMQLTEHIWGNILDDEYDSNYIDVHIKNLRKKISEYVTTDWLQTIRGVGYKVSI